MIKANTFRFVKYSLNPSKKEALFFYEIDLNNGKKLEFTEKLLFPKKIDPSKKYDVLLDNLLKDTHIALGISYYKFYAPEKIEIQYGISKQCADFWSEVYKNGLGEFIFKNNLDPNRIAKFPFDAKIKDEKNELLSINRSLVAIGGGKDSIVSIELLQQAKHDITGFVVETQHSSSIKNETIKKAGIPSLKIKRTIDPRLFERHEDSFNGHVPITAIISTIGMLCAVLYDYQYLILSNEASSDENNVEYKGMEINHQWSKSSKFETLYKQHLKNYISNRFIFSLLRPFTELRIAKMFSKYPKYFSVFSSCNTNFSISKKRSSSLWCGKCPKCASTYLLLSPWISKNSLEKIFGKNLLNDESLDDLYNDLLGFGKLKPFECVGSFDELQAALYASKNQNKNSFITKKYLAKINNGKELLSNSLSTRKAMTVPTQFRLIGMDNILILGYEIKGKNFQKYIKK